MKILYRLILGNAVLSVWLMSAQAQDWGIQNKSPNACALSVTDLLTPTSHAEIDESVRTHRALALRKFAEIKEDPSQFRANFLRVRKAWAQSHPEALMSFPVPELVPYVEYLREILKQKRASLKVSDDLITSTIDRVIDRADQIAKQGAPYEAVHLLTFEFGSANKLMLIAQQKGVSAARDFVKENLGADLSSRSKWKFFDFYKGQDYLRSPDRILLPTAFDLGYATFNRLLVRHIFPIGVKVAEDGVPLEKLGLNDPETFIEHDWFHLVRIPVNELPENIRLDLESKFLTSMNAADMTSLGLSEADKPLFKKCVELMLFSDLHEVNETFGRPSSGRGAFAVQILLAEDSSLRSTKNFENVFPAANNWYKQFWKTHSIER